MVLFIVTVVRRSYTMKGKDNAIYVKNNASTSYKCRNIQLTSKRTALTSKISRHRYTALNTVLMVSTRFLFLVTSY